MRRVSPYPLALLAAASLLLGGCATVQSWFTESTTVEPPAELVDFDAEIDVREIWSRNVGGGIGNQYLKLPPLVMGKRVFAAESRGRVSAYDVDSGDEIWETDTDTPVSGGPGGGEGLVVVGSSDGDVVALNADTGEEKWRTRVSSEVLAAPAAADGVVVVRSIDGKLFGLSTEDGARLWVYDGSVPVLTLRGTARPVIAMGAALAGFDNGSIAAVSLQNGQALWERRIAVPRGRSELERLVDIDADPVVQSGNVYVATFQGQIAALELFSGRVDWQRDLSAYAGLSVDDSNVYVTDADSFVWALDRRNSGSVWRQEKLKARRLTAPLEFNRYVIVGDFEGYVHWLSQEDGRMLARVRVDRRGIIAPPVANSNTVFVYGNGGTLTALRVE